MKITNTQLQQIIKEEAIRLKTRMMLENEKTTILKKLQEIEECDTMEENAVLEEAFTEQEARGWLTTLTKNPTTLKQLQANVNKVMELAKAGTPPAWAAAAFQGKDLNDKAQYAAAYQAVYTLFSNAYVQFFLKNGKAAYEWDVNTNNFKPAEGINKGKMFSFMEENKQPKK